METLAFLRRILPESGLYVIARLTGKGFRHQVCSTLAEAAQYALSFDASGVPTYHACAAYRDESVESAPDKDGKTHKQVRVTRNVRALKCFFMDLDVKPGNPQAFESQEAAIEGLLGFCQATGLPVPMVISSGGGIHIYWTLTNEILPERWKVAAASLKALAGKLEFRADPACTSDPARVLRPVGTWNRKDPTQPRPVELIEDAPDLDPATFEGLVAQALKAHGVKPPVVKPQETESDRLNEQFAIQKSFPPCSAEKVASRCAQLAKMRDTGGCIPEPLWYACIQLLCHSVEGDELTHRWSSGYSGYSRDETDKKIAQVRSQDLGPTLCATFEGRNPGGCEGCPFKDKISTPAQLGAEIQRAAAPVVIDTSDGTPVEIRLPNPPAPFSRQEGGGIFMEKDGILHKIYEHDCFPVDITFDEQVGHEVMRIRHFLPQEGWMEHTVQSSLLAKPADFEMKLRDVHIQPLIRNYMVTYMDAYLRQLRQETKIRRLFRSMGWKDGGSSFVLGDRLYQSDGKMVSAGNAGSTSGFLAGFHQKGDLAEWVKATEIFGFPGLEPHAFMLLLAFAAPLLELGEREGFTVAALGETGAGKSTMGKFLSSVYGSPKETWLGRYATSNARVERLGAYNSIPVYMDEITTIDPKDLRELIYMIPTGKGRDSLTRNRDSRAGAKWQTILIASTNDSLQEKLQMEKQNPEAESMRLFEFEFPRNEDFEFIAKDLHPILDHNYGVAGGAFIQKLVANRETIRGKISPAIAQIEREFEMEGRERFWSQAVALALYGGQLAYEWGLLAFDPAVVRPWLHKETQRMRQDVQSNVVSPATIIGEYLDQHVGERLVVTKLNQGMAAASNARPTRGSLTQRYEKDAEVLWIMRQPLLQWMKERHHNTNRLKKDLYAAGILLNSDDRKILGSGTDLSSGQQVPCWKIRANHEELAAVLKTDEAQEVA